MNEHVRNGVKFRRVGVEDGPALSVPLSHREIKGWLRPADRDDPLTPLECSAVALKDAAHWHTHGFGRWLVRDCGQPVAHGGPCFRLVDRRAEVNVDWAVTSGRWGEGIATLIRREASNVGRRLRVQRIVAFARSQP